MVCIDKPRYVAPEEYDAALQRVACKLGTHSDVSCVYQVGGVSSPGISDLDLVVVFKPGSRFLADPLQGISALEKYLFVHNLFYVREEDFAEAMRCTLFHNYHLLYGTAPQITAPQLDAREKAELQKQVALEYLLNIFLSLTVQMAYQVIKVRGILLHVKAMLYDCQFLGIAAGAFYDALNVVVSLRQRWFETPSLVEEFKEAISQLYAAFPAFLECNMRSVGFYVPNRKTYALARHLVLSPDSRFSVEHVGLVLPSRLARIVPKWMQLQHRWNRFTITVPVSKSEPPPIVQRMFKFTEKARAAQRMSFPHFMCLGSSLHLT